MKNFLKISSIAALFLSLTFTANLIADSGNPAQNANSSKEQWLQYSKSAKKAVATYITMDADGKVVEGVVVGGFKIKNQLLFLRCCTATRNKESWCDASLQDKRC